MLGNSDTGSLLFPPLFTTLLIKSIFVFVCTASFLYLSPSDESEEEDGKMRPSTKEEEDVDMIRSWMQVGGHPAHPEEEAKGLLLEVNAFLCFFSFHLSLSISHLLTCYQFFPQSRCLDCY